MLRPDPNSHSDSSDGEGPGGEGPGSSSKVGLWLVIVVVLSVIGAMTALFIAATGDHDAPESLSGVTLSEAEQRWQSNAPAAYTLELELSGSRSGRITVVVGGAQGAAVDENAAPGTSIARVEDLFQIIRDDLAIVSDPNRTLPPGMAGTAHDPLRASFDPKTGLPTTYVRPLLENRPAFGWRVVTFK